MKPLILLCGLLIGFYGCKTTAPNIPGDPNYVGGVGQGDNYTDTYLNVYYWAINNGKMEQFADGYALAIALHYEERDAERLASVYASAYNKAIDIGNNAVYAFYYAKEKMKNSSENQATTIAQNNDNKHNSDRAKVSQYARDRGLSSDAVKVYVNNYLWASIRELKDANGYADGRALTQNHLQALFYGYAKYLGFNNTKATTYSKARADGNSHSKANQLASL